MFLPFPPTIVAPVDDPMRLELAVTDPATSDATAPLKLPARIELFNVNEPRPSESSWTIPPPLSEAEFPASVLDVIVAVPTLL
jgi:hypothetical protein